MLSLYIYIYIYIYIYDISSLRVNSHYEMFQRVWSQQVGDYKNTNYLGDYKSKIKFLEEERRSRFYVNGNNS
jgi:hypothetical protein